jgi:ROS/MUCR transcriptional regulator protein
MNNEVVDPHLTTKIVSSYVKHHTVGADQAAKLITSVHHAVGRVGQPLQLEEVLTPAVSLRRSVRHDYVICLDCGYRGKTLRRRINRQHGLSRDDYSSAGVEERPPADCPRLFGASLKSGKDVRSWSQAIAARRDASGNTRPDFDRCRSEVRCKTYAETGHSFCIEIRRVSGSTAGPLPTRMRESRSRLGQAGLSAHLEALWVLGQVRRRSSLAA